MQIRGLQPDDLTACADLVARSPFYRTWGLTGTRARALLLAAGDDPGSTLRVAEQEGICGFSWVLARGGFGRSAYLRLLVVDEERARTGVGRALMEDVEATWLADRGVMLLCTSTNERARRFYEALGYQFVGVLEDYVQIGVGECLYYKRREQPGGPAPSSV